MFVVKLCKHELIQGARSLVPTCFGVLVLALACGISGNFLSGSAVFFAVGKTIIRIVYTVMIFVTFFHCAFYGVLRFYRMLGEGAYLELTLPVSLNQQIAAKLISGIFWLLVGAFVATLCSWLVNWEVDLSVFGVVTSSAPVSPAYQLAAWAYLLVLAAAGYLFLFLCCAIGAQLPQWRQPATVVSFFVLSAAVINLIAIGTFLSFSAGGSPFAGTAGWAAAIFSTPSLSIGALLVIFLAIDAALWLLTERLLHWRLDVL